eukprot:COSAG01_NODE_8229_length_2865_cov_2.201374_5_plen_44_part_01
MPGSAICAALARDVGDGGCAEAHTTKTETKPSTEQAARPTEAPR